MEALPVILPMEGAAGPPPTPGRLSSWRAARRRKKQKVFVNSFAGFLCTSYSSNGKEVQNQQTSHAFDLKTFPLAFFREMGRGGRSGGGGRRAEAIKIRPESKRTFFLLPKGKMSLKAISPPPPPPPHALPEEMEKKMYE